MEVPDDDPDVDYNVVNASDVANDSFAFSTGAETWSSGASATQVPGPALFPSPATPDSTGSPFSSDPGLETPPAGSPPEPSHLPPEPESSHSGRGAVVRAIPEDELAVWSEALGQWDARRPKAKAALVARGVPDALRGRVWWLLAEEFGGPAAEAAELVAQFPRLSSQRGRYDGIIENDVLRTFQVICMPPGTRWPLPRLHVAQGPHTLPGLGQ